MYNDMATVLTVWFFAFLIYKQHIKPLIGFKSKPFKEKKRIALLLNEMD